MKKVYLETFGCQMNVSDSERAATHLAAEGYEITADEAQADVVVFNTCSVRQKAEHKLLTRVGEVRNSGREPMIGIMGCVAQLEGDTLFKRVPKLDFVLGTSSVGRIGKAITAVAEGKSKVADLGAREENYDWTVADKMRHSPYVAFVPIIEGCNKFCTYCIVPFSRGRERSLPASDIIREVLRLKRDGVKEVHLIGQNVNSYRPKVETGLEDFDGATPFSRLLRAVSATGIERLKFTTSFPRDFHPDIVAAMDENEQLCNWVHLPVQSGSDRILRAMRRGHTIDSYKKKIDVIRASKRNIAISTDLIVGFPGETEEDFHATVKLAKYCAYDTAYVFKYSPRPGTPAFELGDTVPEDVKTKRFLELESTLRESQMTAALGLVGKSVQVLAERPSKKDETVLSGHSTCHRTVNFVAKGAKLGDIVDVGITEAHKNGLFGVQV